MNLERRNYPPGTREVDKDDICPYYSLIEICGQLANVNVTKKDFFCGVEEQNKPKDASIYDSTPYEPKSDCSEICIILRKDFDKAVEKIEVPDESAIKDNIRNVPLEDSRLKINKWYELKTKKSTQDKILNRWKRVIWTNLDKKTIKPEKFLKNVKKPSDLTNEYVISFAKNALIHLQKIANRKKTDYIIKVGDPKTTITQCPLAPQKEEVRSGYIQLQEWDDSTD
jgi:hypothetical protein